MANILIPISNGFEEIEAISIIDVCRRANIEVTIAAVEDLTTIGAHNIKKTKRSDIHNSLSRLGRDQSNWAGNNRTNQ